MSAPWIWAGTFFFSIGYFFHYHISHNGTSVADSYEQDMAEARETEAKQSLAEPVNEESLGKLMTNPALMTDAKALFGLRCSPCHGATADGNGITRRSRRTSTHCGGATGR